MNKAEKKCAEFLAALYDEDNLPGFNEQIVIDQTVRGNDWPNGRSFQIKVIQKPNEPGDQG
jgi:hypothetical protein